MITITQHRAKEEGDTYNHTQTALLSKAASILVTCELQFGGRLIINTLEKIQTRTSVMGCVDLTTFEGPEEEMRELHWLAERYNNYRESLRTAGEQVALITSVKINTTIEIASIAVKVLYDYLKVELPAAVVNRASSDDLLAAVSMVLDKEATREEALSLIH